MFDFDFTGMIGKASAVQKVFDKLIDLDVLENGMDAGFRFYQKEMWEKFLEIFHGSEEAGMFQAATGTGKTYASDNSRCPRCPSGCSAGRQCRRRCR